MAGVFGKIVGGAIGFALGGGPLGALFGMAVGHAYDNRRDMPQRASWQFESGMAPMDDAGRQKIFTQSVVALSAKLAKVDGRVTHAEIDAFKRVFEIKREQEIGIGRAFDQARLNPHDFEPYAFRLAQAYQTQPVVIEQVMTNLFKIAAADIDGEPKILAPSEARFLKQVSFIMNITPQEYVRMAARAGVQLPNTDTMREQERNTSDDPLVVLGLKAKANNDDIKAAYRQLIREHHPDKLAAAGKSSESIAAATEKMKRINAAYDVLSRSRGIK